MQNFPILFRFNDPSMPSALNNLKLHWQVVRGTEGLCNQPNCAANPLRILLVELQVASARFCMARKSAGQKTERQQDRKTDGNNR